MIRSRIYFLLKKLGMKNFSIFESSKKEFGDYYVTFPFKIAKTLKEKIEKKIPDFLEKIEFKEPCFLNFFISKKILIKEIKEILKKREKYGELKIGRNIKTQVEFISANPTGPLHIGNGRGAFFGDVLSNVLEKAGFKVEREYYINDARANAQIKTLGRTALGKGKIYLTPYLKFQISKLKTKTQISKLSEGEIGYQLAQLIQKDIKDFVEKRLKIKFDNYISEEDLYQKSKIKKIIKFLENKKLVYEKEGAKWLKISKYGAQKDEVILRKDGSPTYFLSDIAYHKDKFDRGFKKIINIWGADHQGHVPKIKAASKTLGFKGKLEILISQLVRLKGKQKLSKRKGKIITLEDLIDEIGQDMARFLYLTKSLNSQMELDLKLAREQSQKNPLFYIQYAHVRICGVLRKCRKFQIPNSKFENLKLLNHPSEILLMKKLIKFPEIVEDTAKDYQVQRIPQYAFDLATLFHQFYRDCKVITQDKFLFEARLSLILATKIILSNVFSLMRISLPERM